MTRLIIAGGGLAGCLAALALQRRRSDIQVTLVEQQSAFGGNHIWSFFDTDIDPSHRWVIKDLAEFRWPEHEVHFPNRSRTIAAGYNSLRSAALDRLVRARLQPDRYRLGAEIRSIGPDHVELASGERMEADAVVDARGGGAFAGLQLGWQKFVGRLLEFSGEHRVRRPIIMDATVEQHDGYRFFYFLPLSRTRLFVEDTYYSSSPSLDRDLIGRRIEQAARRLNSGTFQALSEESGVLPVVLDGDFDHFWKTDDDLPRLGVGGGFFHPTTSYSLPDAVANAAWLAEQHDLSSGALAQMTRSRSKGLWRERSFYRMLNRMLFRAARPDQSYKILEHFYRLPQDVIARFYAARLTSIDKLRILSGRPPVPIGRALMAMRRSAA